MNTNGLSLSKSSESKLGLKLLVIVAVILLLLVPLAMISKIAAERKERALNAGEEIIGLNGGRPEVIGPVLIVPVTIMSRGEKNTLIATRYHVAILPEKLDVSGNLTTEMRSRGIYKVPLFSGTIRVQADFGASQDKLEQLLATEQYTVDWNNAWYSMELTDKRSLKSTPVLTVNGGAPVAMKGSESLLGWHGSSVKTRARVTDKATHVDVSLALGGGGSLMIYPFGETVSCAITSDWKAPSFTGYVLPAGYTIGESGFNASWFIPDSAKPYPDAFIVESTETVFADASFGVEFFQPVSVYHKTERALKYGLLFIVVPFVVFFLFEIFLKKRIHPLQYTLIGFADVLFYLILLSFSEHLPFMTAYATGALAVCLLVAFYSASILGNWKRGLVMIPTLGGIYLYLYVALESEDYALIVGAVGVFALLACFMILTRKIDWYALSLPGKKEEAERADSVQ